MAAQSLRVSAQHRPSPKYINWQYTRGILYHFEGSEETLLAAGIISQEHVPGHNMRSYKSPKEDGGVFKCGRLANGGVRAVVCATKIIDQDPAFKSFIGGILADTRLSLVKGESNV